MYKYANLEETAITDTESGALIPVGHRVHNEIVKSGETIEPFETPEEKSSREQEEAKQAFIEQQRQARMDGVSINGVMCSATKDDQNGLMAVLQDYNFYKAFNDGDGSDWAYFGFQFKNGSVLDIDENMITQIFLVWGAFRKQVTQPYKG